MRPWREWATGWFAMGKVRRRRRWSIRSRTVATAAGTLAIALVVVGVVLVFAVRAAQVGAIDQSLRSASNAVTNQLRSTGRVSGVLVNPPGIALVQITDARGRIVAQSASIAGEPAIGVAIRSGRIQSFAHLPVGGDEPFRVSSQLVVTSRGIDRVVVAVSLGSVVQTTNDLLVALGIGLPVLLTLVALVVWWLVGSALGAVERLRTDVAALATREKRARVGTDAMPAEINRLATTMNDMLERLDAADLRQRTFVADASHELKSPIAAARTELEVALRDRAVAWPGVAHLVLDDLERVRRILDDLLTLARFDEGVDLRRLPMDLDDVVFAECASLQRRARVSLDVSRVSGARVLGDRDALARVVRNLLENANAHATSRITVSLDARELVVTLLICNDGPRIAPSDRSRIFERFTRLDAARSPRDGASGLGLAIVAETIREHGGTVRLDVETAETTFRVELAAVT